jgi:hypothetical protein
MHDVSLLILGGFGAMVIWFIFRVASSLWPRKPMGSHPCIHGYEDWDDCPDCCH